MVPLVSGLTDKRRLRRADIVEYERIDVSAGGQPNRDGSEADRYEVNLLEVQ